MDGPTSGLRFGELFRDPRHVRSDLQLVRRAIREGWPMDDQTLRVVLDRVRALADEPDASDRVKLGACRVVAELLRVTQAALSAELRGASLLSSRES